MTRRARKGFTLIEMMVSMTLLVIIMGSVFGVMAQSQREYAEQREVVRAKETLQGVESVTAADVMRVANDLFSGCPLAATVVGAGSPSLEGERLALE